MKIKEGVILTGLKIPMREVLIKANLTWSRLKQELVVTSGLDGQHSPGSLHAFGYALDLRTRYFTPDIKRLAFYRLRKKLSIVSYFYELVLHETHIHVEFDIIKYQMAYEEYKIKCFTEDLEWKRFLM